MKAISFFIKVSLLILLMAGLAYSQGYPPTPAKTENRCSIIPQQYPCKGFFTVYYFDARTGKCKEISGCYESVFDTLEECQKLCEKTEGAKPVKTSSSEALFDYLNQGNGDPDKVKRWIEKGADVNYSDSQYRITPLHNVAHYGHFEAARVLLDHGADVNAKNIEGNTALYAAVHEQHIKIASLLLEKGADVNTKNKFGYTPVRAASRNGNLRILKLLIEKGGQVNVRDYKGNFPIHVAAEEGRVEVVKMLIEAGADVNAMGHFNDTPLHIASGRGLREIVKLLLDHGADPNARGKYGRTPLHAASFNGLTDIVKYLLGKGADVNAKDEDGQTALDLAPTDFDQETFRFLKWFMEEQKRGKKL